MAGMILHVLIMLEFAPYILARGAVIIIGAVIAGYWWWRKPPCRNWPDPDLDVHGDKYNPRKVTGRTIRTVCPDEDDYERLKRGRKTGEGP